MLSIATKFIREGTRYDSIPFANGMINAGMSCQLVHYVHEEHEKFFEVCKFQSTHVLQF